MRTMYRQTNVGQIPGARYDARVVDQNGNGLYAGFFYLDANGTPIMNDVYTDGEGYFHFTVPDYNHESIFIQFYATEQYEPVVKTFKEIVENPNIVLKKKSSGALPLILLAGLGVVALSQKSSHVGSFEGGKRIKEKWNNLPQRNKIATGVVVAGGAAVALYLIFKYKPTKAQSDFLNATKTKLEYLAKEKGIVPSLPISQFEILTVQIVKALDKCGTEFDVIGRAFASLNNEADFWKLCQVFGIQKYDGCFEGNLPSFNVHYTLPEALASDLDGQEIYTLNMILQEKQINISL